MKRFAVLASGNGSNLQAIIDAVKKKKIGAQLVLVFSDKPDAFALSRAKKASIPSVTLSPKEFDTRQAFDIAVLAILRAHKVDFVVLAGYMRLLSPEFIEAYADKILNVHPSLLPSFKGTHAIKDAFDAGVKITGPTVHFVVEAMDAGAIIAQQAVEVTAKDTLDTLTTKIHAAEHLIYPKVIDLFAKGKVKLTNGKVKIT